ncbi:MAG: beta-galactosidase [Ruminococcaceae bacterium]|nr:beta-galactosidase [Oscillospiraceae bacterium]
MSRTYSDKFAPDRLLFTPEEACARRGWCLNGRWQFAPMPIGADYVKGSGVPPVLPWPDAEDFSDTPIYIPSPWNGNVWGNGRVDRTDGAMRYAPDSVYYPSYPAAWDHAKQGWLRRTVTLPAGEAGRRLFLHFESVMGHADVYVNGQKAGEHFDSFLPFDVEVTDLLHEGENELTVGVQQMHLFDKQSDTYRLMRTPYAHGSNTQDLAGIWQDVYLVSLPAVYIKDVYIRPQADEGRLECDVTLVNTTDTAQTVTLDGTVCPFCCTPDAAVPDGRLGDAVLALPRAIVELTAGETTTVTVAARDVTLPYWTPDTPRLHALCLTAHTAECEDRQVTRFGWRQWRLAGKELLLNGEPIRLIADICHPFGPFMFSRPFIQSWYRLIKSVGGNAVRLHAQPHPQVFLDVADEMGIAVLDETAIFGSCLTLNFEDDIAWERYAAHLDDLVRRDRNRASVCGWSFGNELFAIFLYDDAAKRDQDRFYEKLIALGKRVKVLDTTRDFITCDGDEDLRGTLPVWSKHYGHGARTLPAVDKPMVVGENGGTYYARPAQMATFNGERAYESYAGRNEALGIDLYNNLRAFQNDLIYFSPSELMWFGLEQLPYGYDDFSRLPTLEDGIRFPYVSEGEAGLYIERIPPYVGTLNPGWDPTLPERRELAMVTAMRDATARDDALNAKWAPRTTTLPPAPTYDRRATVSFLGSGESALYQRLGDAGVTFVRGGEALAVDAATCRDDAIERIREVTANGGTVLLHVDSEAAAEKVASWLGDTLTLTDRRATQLARGCDHPFVFSIPVELLYFAENEQEKAILTHGLDGGLLARGTPLLKAAATDWSLFNDQPENRKCGAVQMYEMLEKPSGAAWVLLPYGAGRIVLSSLNVNADSVAHRALWNRLMRDIGWAVGAPRTLEETHAIKQHDLLLNGPIDT